MSLLNLKPFFNVTAMGQTGAKGFEFLNNSPFSISLRKRKIKIIKVSENVTGME
jgi:hypothetical protein